jgi:Flp pilus assembly protein TadD
MKRTLVILASIAAVLIAVAVVSGRHRVPEGEIWVRFDRGGHPTAEVAPGSHWWPPLSGRIARFPTAPDTLFFPDPAQAETYRLFDAEGNSIPTRFAVTYRAEPGRGVALARALEGDAAAAPGMSDAGLAVTVRARLLRDGRAIAARFSGDALRADGGRGLAEELARAVRLDGLTVTAAPWSGGTATGGVKVLIVGVDAADWLVVDPLLRAGRMPNLAALIRRGVRADFHTLRPMLSPLLWTSIATGVTPERHGILDFISPDPRTGEMVPVSSTFRRVPAFWNILTQYNVSQGIVAWLATWPAESVSGHLITDRFGFLAYAGQAAEGDRGMTWPPEYEEHARSLEVPAGSLPVAFWKRFFDVPDRELTGLGKTGFRKGNLIENFALTVSTALTSTAIGEDLQRTADPRVLAVYYEMIDAAGHLTMPYAPPRRPQIGVEDFKRYSGALDATYQLQDELLGRLVAGADTANTVVLVLSDHGMKSGDARPGGSAEIVGGEAGRWHRDPGVLVLAGPGIRRGATLSGDANVLDIAPTLLAMLGLPVPRTMQGKILVEAFDETGRTRYAPARVDSLALRAEVWSPPLGGASAATGPTQASFYNNLGLVLEADGKLAEAEAEYRRALGMVPDDPRARNNLGGVLLKLGRIAEARDILERLHRERSDYIPVLFNLAMLYQQVERFAEAETLYRSILQREPGNVKAEVDLGHTLVRLNRLDEAETLFRAALAATPGEINAHFGLGLVAATRGDLAAAAAEFRRTLELDPNHASAAQNLQAVERARGASPR